MGLIKSDGAVVFTEDTHVNVSGSSGFKLPESPVHESFAESVAEEFPADVDLPELHGIWRWVFDGNVDRADFDEGDEVVAIVDDLMGEFGVGQFLGHDFLGIDFGEEGFEIFGGVEGAEGFDEGITAELGEPGKVVGSRGAELEWGRHFWEESRKTRWLGRVGDLPADWKPRRVWRAIDFRLSCSTSAKKSLNPASRASWSISLTASVMIPG